MGDLSVSNGGARSPMWRDKDYVTVGKVQNAVNVLLQNDKKLHENQETLRTEGLTTASRVADLEHALATLSAQHAGLERRVNEMDAKRLGARLARAWRWLARSVVWRAD